MARIDTGAGLGIVLCVRNRRKVSEMNDREMLEMAAKAAGLEVVFSGDECFLAELHGNPSFLFIKRWNPRDDDGDALRLAVKLRMEIDHNHPADYAPWVSVRAQGERNCSVVEFDMEQERMGATRLAIVRAAAEIGRSM